MNPIKTTLLTLSLLTASVGVQAAELPQSAVLQYSGSYGIPATMTFTRSGNQYKIVSTIKVPLYNIRFESGGSINGTTLHPSYYKDVRGGKVYAEAKFSGGNITYGKAGDLFTLAWQLAANDVRLPSGLKITNGKKLYTVGSMNKIGNESYKLNGGTTPVSKYRVRRGDDTVTYSFASDIDNIPAQISYTDDGKTYNLKLTSVKINGKVVKP